MTSLNRLDSRTAIPQLEKSIEEIKTSCPFPIGYVLLMNNETNPNDIYTGTTWENIGSNCYLVGSGDHEIGESGGSNSITIETSNLPSHSHLMSHGHTFTQPTVDGGGVTEGITGGSHLHSMGSLWSDGSGSQSAYTMSTDRIRKERTTIEETHTHDLPNHTHTVSGGAVDYYSGYTYSTGSGNDLDIEPTYYSVAIWARTA